MAVRGMNIMSAMHKQAVCSIDSSLALPRMGLCLELMNIKVNERRKIAAEVFNIYVFTCACVRACVRACCTRIRFFMSYLVAHIRKTLVVKWLSLLCDILMRPASWSGGQSL